MRGRSTTTISLSAADAIVCENALLAEGSEGLARRLDVVEHADEADEGLSTLLRRLRSRGRAAFEMNEGRRAAPAVLSSNITCRPSQLIGKPFDGSTITPGKVRPRKIGEGQATLRKV
jgi:hypothetical protein